MVFGSIVAGTAALPVLASIPQSASSGVGDAADHPAPGFVGAVDVVPLPAPDTPGIVSTGVVVGSVLRPADRTVCTIAKERRITMIPTAVYMITFLASSTLLSSPAAVMYKNPA